MTDSHDPSTLDDPRDAAAFWFARTRSGQMTPSEREAFEAWRRASPAHDREYRVLMGIWNATTVLPAERLRALTREPGAARGGRLASRRGFGIGLGLACTAAVVAGVALPSLWEGAPSYAQEFSTRRGERREVMLPDNSILQLNTGTQVKIMFYERRRVAELAAGEITFSVEKDAAQPFFVEAASTTVRVTGTRFNVRRDDDAVQVAVDSGTVEVSSGHWWNRRRARLTAGHGVGTTANGGLAAVQAVDVATLLAWQQGRIVFQDTPLAQAVREMNRYAPMAIQLSGSRLAGVRIAGVFSADHPQSFLDLLPEIAPVRVLIQPNGASIITAR
ncbi:FecR family protein [Pollutimonas bauzanensis]|uniref:FecR family protein n=1 Tax=Pollutimonas bauzanensis TaxID=658167 RepID=A0A1M5MPZ1_9BURK|nr:FecR domain-containing protein [Pollutimonas bauzanensis]SHG79368.1 FecR family protein [Pollutimonas bauzanensis]